jgi:hypothetical protein
MVPLISAEVRSSGRTSLTVTIERQTGGSRAGARRDRTVRTKSGPNQVAGVSTANDTRGTGMQQGEENDRGRVRHRVTRPRIVGSANLHRESSNRRRSLRSWRPDVTPTSNG